MSSSTKDQLRQAYDLILANQFDAAIQILMPICKSEPDNVNAWWLAANAFQEPERAKLALKKVLAINPDHAQAKARWEELDTAKVRTATMTMPTIPVQPKISPPPSQSNNSGVWIIVGGIVLLATIGAVAAFLLTSSQRDSASTATLPTTIPTQVAQSNAQTAPTLTRTPLPTAADLAATWTPSPSPTQDMRPTITPWWDTTPPATADPALFGETYWEGLGDGITMESQTRSGGRHLRFINLPVKVWMERRDDPIWEAAFANAIEEIGQVVPLEVVESEPEADLTIYIEEAYDFNKIIPCQSTDALTETIGCNFGPLNFGDVVGGDRYHRIISIAYINADTDNPFGVLLHEMMHAMGIIVHSPYEDDMMFPIENGRTTLSERDLNTLARLYANPSYAD